MECDNDECGAPLDELDGVMVISATGFLGNAPTVTVVCGTACAIRMLARGAGYPERNRDLWLEGSTPACPACGGEVIG